MCDITGHFKTVVLAVVLATLLYCDVEAAKRHKAKQVTSSPSALCSNDTLLRQQFDERLQALTAARRLTVGLDGCYDSQNIKSRVSASCVASSSPTQRP